MNDDRFQPGLLLWTSGFLEADQLKEKYLQQEWDAGFAAFSNCERSLDDIGGMDRLSSCLAGRSDLSGGTEGFLMEAGLWRKKNDGNYEELAFEREGDAFFVQYWQLFTLGKTQPSKADMHQCYFRRAHTFARGNISIFTGKLGTFEVIVPSYRLRFYITRGE